MRELADRSAIRALIENLAHSIDQRDFDGILSRATPNVHFLQINEGAAEPNIELYGRGELLLELKNLNNIESLSTLLGSCLIELGGSEATAETNCVSYVRFVIDDDHVLTTVSYRLIDRFTRQDGGDWLIADRHGIVAWTDTRPSQP
ncbi:nuclear transport factor 2 family protein [Sciscionella sediminilitoris]|uniref:nuclear transport factor 2 family protein n=1 Tax=Sciscionella sediminilitoris TaxID=1445613 RepID=UPI0004DFAB64|nr:nuclear transport factor 2 family protein [Sciscionella sp. SE31]